MNPISFKEDVGFVFFVVQYSFFCHPDGGRISARNSAKKIANLCRAAYGDPSSVRMTRLWILYVVASEIASFLAMTLN